MCFHVWSSDHTAWQRWLTFQGTTKERLCLWLFLRKLSPKPKLNSFLWNWQLIRGFFFSNSSGPLMDLSKKKVGIWLQMVPRLNTPIKRRSTKIWAMVFYWMPSTATTVVYSPMAKQEPVNLTAYLVHSPTKVLCPIFAKDFSRKSRKNRKVIKISSSRSLSVWLRFTRNRCAIYWIPKAWLILKVYRFMRDQEKDFTVSFF